MIEEAFFIDPHVHTKNSPCSKLTRKQILNKAHERELNAICITDHDTITLMPTDEIILILSGSEVSTKHGHILAYGISEPIPIMLSAEETLDKIHEQGGIAIAAHPYRKYDKENSEIFGLGNSDKLFSCKLEGIETLNYLNNSKENEKARKSAKLLALPMIGGSDAHEEDEVGKVVTKTPTPMSCLDDFIKSIKMGKTIPMMNR